MRQTLLLFCVDICVCLSCFESVMGAGAPTDEQRQHFIELATQAADTKIEKTRLALWSAFLEGSEQYAETHDDMQLWFWRAVGALSLDRPREGAEAGGKLMSFGILESQVPAVRKLVAALALEGWLKRPTVDPNAKAWMGKWVSDQIEMEGQSKVRALRTIIIGLDQSDKLRVLLYSRYAFGLGSRDFCESINQYPGPGFWVNSKGIKVSTNDGRITSFSWANDFSTLKLTFVLTNSRKEETSYDDAYTLDPSKTILKRNDGLSFMKE